MEKNDNLRKKGKLIKKKKRERYVGNKRVRCHTHGSLYSSTISMSWPHTCSRY